MATTKNSIRYVDPKEGVFDPSAMGLPSWIEAKNIKQTSDGNIAILDEKNKTKILASNDNGTLKKIKVASIDAVPQKQSSSQNQQSLEDILSGTAAGTMLPGTSAPILDWKTFNDNILSHVADNSFNSESRGAYSKQLGADLGGQALIGVANLKDSYISSRDTGDGPTIYAPEENRKIASQYGLNLDNYTMGDGYNYSALNNDIRSKELAKSISDPNTVYNISGDQIQEDGSTRGGREYSLMRYKHVGDKLVPIAKKDGKESSAWVGFRDNGAIPIASVLVNAFVPGLGAAIGGALGATGTTASVIGGAVIGGTTSGLSGGNILTGAITGGLGASTGLLSDALSPVFGDASTMVSRAAIGGIKAAINGGDIVNAMAGSLIPSTGNSGFDSVINTAVRQLLPVSPQRRNG